MLHGLSSLVSRFRLSAGTLGARFGRRRALTPLKPPMSVSLSPFPMMRPAACSVSSLLTRTPPRGLRRFEEFVQDRTQQDEQETRQAFEDHQTTLAGAALPASDLLAGVILIRDELGQPALAGLVRRFAIAAQWRLRRLLRYNAAPDTPAPELPAAELIAASTELASRATALLSDDQSQARLELKREHQELQDRKWLAGIKDDVLAEIERKRQLGRLNSALRDTVHTQISNKSSALSETLVTNRLPRPVCTGDRSNEHSWASHRTAQNSDTPWRSAVSCQPDPQARRQGRPSSQRRRASLCLLWPHFSLSFPLQTVSQALCSTIQFPRSITLHREHIADRLAEEGRNRQVIVFTHDLPFLFLLERSCREHDTEVALRACPEARAGSRPLRKHATDESANTLSNGYSHCKSISTTLAFSMNRNPSGVWLFTAKGLLAHLRDTWESAVEGVVAPVLRTFSSKIDTRGFGKLSAITLQDADDMRAGYGRCSALLHKASDALNPAVPTPDQIADELSALRCWIDNLQTRQVHIKMA